MLTKIHHSLVDGLSGAEIMGVLLDLVARGPRAARAAGGQPPTASPGELEMLAPRPARPAALPAAAPARAPVGAAEPRRDRLQHAAGRRHRRARGRRASAAPCAGGDGGVLERTTLQGAAHVLQRAHLAAPALRLRPAPAGRRQARQEPARLHGQRRGGVDLRRRGAPLAGGARRAARRAARGPDPGVGAQLRADGHLRQPDHAHERAAVHQCRGPGGAPAADARGAARDEGAPPRAARGAAPGRQPLHPAGRVLARGARDLRALDRGAGAADVEPRDLERARARSSRSTAPAPGSRPTTRCR